MNDAMERLLAQQACRDLVVQAAACADAGDPQALARLFAADAVLVRPHAPPLQGRDAILEAYGQRAAGRLTRHLVTNTWVEFDAPDLARARSYVLLWSGDPASPASPDGLDGLDGPDGLRAQPRQRVGEFADQFARQPDGRWLIQRREARFVLHRDG